MRRRWAASLSRRNGRTPSSTVTDAAACMSASPVDIEAESAPAQKSPTTSTGSSVRRIRNGRMKSGSGGDSGSSTPAKPIRKTGTRKS